ncbi:MAG: nuclear transport factor 2 family protein [Cyclobacteriaceae bacterium]
MKNLRTSLILLCLFQIGVYGKTQAQSVSARTQNKIEKEILAVFLNNIEAGEKLDVSAIEQSTNDHLKAGFIDNGIYYNSFDGVMSQFKKGIVGLEYQKINIASKKITVLSEKSVLLTAMGNFSAKVTDGRVLQGGFAWTFVFSRINEQWKVIHSHMSNKN